ncbi:MAG: SusC/RagA family TonB-linked outer membrane protein, partial [Verrucomicrobia bacterium]|nr:SusC/RagA family TonB-linked outer membrane protein [Cytophagales bacterium]
MIQPIFGQRIPVLTTSQVAILTKPPLAIRVTGTVTSAEDKQPIPGVNVLVKGTTIGVSTDPNGRYALDIPNDDAILIFSFLGYTTQEIEVKGKTTIDITLVEDISQLSEVVVIGYGTSDKKDLTGAITSISSEEFNQGVLTTPAQLLQGKVAGLNITKSGDPNQRPAVILRGPSTLRSGGAQEPFYVIDGVPGASIDLLAPSDIETIDVLKDASSTAIYGSRAANGVIIVTTKRAKSGQTMLSYSNYVALEEVSKKIDMLTAPELRQYLADNGQSITVAADDDGSNTNWQDLVLRSAVSQNHNLSFGSANQTTEYGLSINYLKNEGILKNTALERVIVRGNISQRFFNNRLKLGVNFTNSSSNSLDQNSFLPGISYQNAILSNMLFYLPTVSPFNADGTYKENYNRTGSGTRNPLSIVDNNIIENKNNKLLINGLMQVDILDGLKFTLSYSTQRDQNNVGAYFNSASGLAVGLGGIARRNATLNKFDIVEGYFNYDKNFGKHEIKLLAGYSWQQDR